MKNRENDIECNDFECYKICRNYDNSTPGRLSYAKYCFLLVKLMYKVS